MSSLAAQLAGIQANNNATILEKSKRKKIHSVSLIYEPKEAATQDFESIYYGALESFKDLELIDKRFSSFSKTLFSETSIRFDRLVQQADQVSSLNATIDRFLLLLSRYLHLQPALGSLEWLIRRFHIHLHNTEQLILSTLPWYNADVFIRILDVIPVNNFPPLFKFLTTNKANLRNPNKNTLIRTMHNDRALYELVNTYILDSADADLEYNRQLVFWSSINIWVLMVYKDSNNSDILDVLLPLVSRMLPLKSKSSCQMAAYMVLIVVCSQFQLEEDIIQAAISTITSTWSSKSQVHGLAAVSQLVRYSQDQAEVAFDESVWLRINEVPNLSSEIVVLGKSHNIQPFIQKWALSLLKFSVGSIEDLRQVLFEVPSMNSELLVQIFTAVVNTISGGLNAEIKNEFVSFLEWAATNHSDELVKALDSAGLDFDNLELALESSLPRPHKEAEVDEEPKEVPISNGTSATPKAELVKESNAIPKSTSLCFLSCDNAERDLRAKLWIKISSSPEFTPEELPKLVRTCPLRIATFWAAMAIGPYPLVCRIAAVKALSDNIASPADTYDYQGLLPTVLYLLSDSSREIREVAAKIVFTIFEQSGSKAEKIYGLETLYGTERSASIMCLSRADLKAVLKHIISHVRESVLDPNYIVKLASTAGKSAWLQFLTSHALATEIPQLLKFMLDILAGHKGVTKSLSPLLGSWTTERENWKARAEQFKVSFFELEKSLVSTVQSNDQTGLDFLQTALAGNVNLAEAAAAQVVLIWNQNLLRPESKKQLFSKILDVATSSQSSYDPMPALASLQLDTTSFLEILEESKLQREHIFNPSANGGPMKRRRRRSSSSVQLKDASSEVISMAEHHLQKLTLVLELLDQNASKITEPSKLFPQLFQVLDELISLGTDSNLPVLYTEELLANCLINLVEQDRTTEGDMSQKYSSVRVDVIVSCIRTSSSPQVQNKLLLLISSLASVVPDLVFHSVMPIFTFMGANTVRLDNDYSAHVIQQTISQVIPALVACGDKQEEIEIALRSFVAAFPHIPRHRRNKLYSALIKTLGPSESLHKLLLLLGQKYGESLNKKRFADSKSLMHFTTTFVRSFTVYEQLLSLERCLEYMQTMASAEEEADLVNVPLLQLRGEGMSLPQLKVSLLNFLTLTFGNDDVISGMQPLQIQISADNDMTPENLALAAKIIDMLLAAENDESADVREAALELLSKCLELLPIDKFVNVISDLIEDQSNVDILERSLDLVEKKFELEVAGDEVAINAAFSMLEVLNSALVKESDDLKPKIIDGIDTIVVKFSASIEPQVQSSVLEILVGNSGILNESIDVIVSAINCINSISQNLGARMIGFFGRILPVLFSKIELANQNGNGEEPESQTLQLATFGLLSGLIMRIPSFMSSPTKRMFELIFTSSIDLTSRAKLLGLINEKMDSQTVISAYVSTWDDAVQGGTKAIGLFLDGLDEVIEVSSKKEIASKASQLVGLLLKSFTVRATQRFNTNEVNQIEARVVKTGVDIVLKLNDKVFRPLFVRMTRWAFDGEGTVMPAQMRNIIMFKFIVKLLGRLKSIVTKYFGYILTPACDILEGLKAEDEDSDQTVRKLIYQSFVLSFASDTDDFWQSPARFDKVMSVFLKQLEQVPMKQGPLLVKSIVGLAETAASQEHRKKINDGLSGLLTSDPASTTKVWTIRVLSSLYTRLGEDWVSVLPQLVPIIAELLEDDDEDVEMEVRRKLVPVIEDVLGESLDRYLS